MLFRSPRVERTISLPQNQGSEPIEENAGVGRHQQEAADLDLYSGKEKAVLQSRQSVWRSPQKPAHGSVKSFCAAIISQVKAQGQGDFLHLSTEAVCKHNPALCLYPYMLNEGM